ncbi:MAG TPA: MerC domain-containing protein [Cyclobacteriaceae bacterium]
MRKRTLMNSNSRLIFLDKLGMCTSVVCMAHCMAIPFLFIFGLDSTLSVIDNEFLELMIIFTSLAIGLVSFIRGFIQHRQHFILVLFIAGFFLIVSGERIHETWSSASISVIGAMVITYAHFQNITYKKTCSY